MSIKWIGSPNFDTNRKTIDRIVMHWMDGTLAGTDSWFQRAGGTSSTYGIEDKDIHQYVKEENVAYHAGNYAMNQRSIGIEHSAGKDRPPSEETYQTSAALVADICRRYNIPLDRAHIIKHSEVKATQCPGSLDIDKIIQLAKGQTMPEDWATERDRLIGRAVVAKEIVIYLEIPGDPDQTPIKAIKSKIGGIKSRVTDLSNQVSDLTGKLTVANEKVSSLEKQVLEGAEREKALNTALNDAHLANEKLRSVYEGQFDGQKIQLDTCQKAKQDLITDNATLKTTVQNQKDRIDNFLKGEAKVIGFSEWLPMGLTILVEKIKKLFPGKKVS